MGLLAAMERNIDKRGTESGFIYDAANKAFREEIRKYRRKTAVKRTLLFPVSYAAWWAWKARRFGWQELIPRSIRYRIREVILKSGYHGGMYCRRRQVARFLLKLSKD